MAISEDDVREVFRGLENGNDAKVLRQCRRHD